MARENNFLLGFGERLTTNVSVRSGGGDKNPPYDFYEARQQMGNWLSNANEYFSKLPQDACPNDQVTGIITMHPRYISKSEFPSELLNKVGLRAVGGRTKKIKPREWGVKKHPEEAITDQLFVMGSRKSFASWSSLIHDWQPSGSTNQLTKFEEFSPFFVEHKIKKLPQDNKETLLEVVLHDNITTKIIEQFNEFSSEQGAKVIIDRLRRVKGLTFIPVYANREIAYNLAQFSFIRALREMPGMRPLNPHPTRNRSFHQVLMPQEEPIDKITRIAVFDGGIPNRNPVSNWINYIEPKNLSAPVPDFLEHGLNVTSALLFGPLDVNETVPRPLCAVDHIRVLDDKTGSGGDFEYYDVLDRILETLDNAKLNNTPYDFINISLGPDIPIEDDDITRWTSDLDIRLAGGDTFVTVAAGNAGLRDSVSGLNRVQPPSDAVNVLSIGACDIDKGTGWGRAPYSCVGPGRLPGLVKPDGVVFGGDTYNPFYVLTSLAGSAYATGVTGTSFASPYALRSAIAVRTQLGSDFSALAIRALLIHRATREQNHTLQEVGWGRFETDYDRLVTCDDDEALIVFQGELPVREHLRAPVPLPDGSLSGMVTIEATLVISPEVDASFPNAYTRAGLEVAFRPNSDEFNTNEDGKKSQHAKTKSFFSVSNMKLTEYLLRDGGHKWEPCLSASRKFNSKSLKNPCFDIYYHNRYEGMALKDDPEPIPYALIVSIKAPKVQNLYNRVVRTYMNMLVPLKPQTRIQIRP